MRHECPLDDDTDAGRMGGDTADQDLDKSGRRESNSRSGIGGTLRRRVRRSPRQLVERRQGQSPAFLQCRSRGDGGQAGGSGHRRKTGTALAAGTSVSGNDPRGSPRIPRQCGCSYPLRERLATNSGPRILDKSGPLLARDVEFCSMSSQRSKSLSATS